MTYNDEDIRFLSELSGFGRYKCEKTLKTCDGDIDRALSELSALKSNQFEVAKDILISSILGERGCRLAVYEDDSLLVSVPFLVLLLILVLISIPSWVIACVLSVFVIFGMELKIEFVQKHRLRDFSAVNAEAYKQKKRARAAAEKKAKTQESGMSEDADGYNEIIIE